MLKNLWEKIINWFKSEEIIIVMDKIKITAEMKEDIAKAEASVKNIVDAIKAKEAKLNANLVHDEVKTKSILDKLFTWLKENWMIIVNYLVIFIAYSNIYDHAEFVVIEALLGLWLFTSGAILIYKIFNKK